MISFKGRHFKNIIILMAIRWYLAYALSYRNIEELMAGRGITVDHSTINRWVVKYSPKLEAEFAKRQKNKIGNSWRMDETNIRIKGKCCYLYRAFDKAGATIDFMLSKNRDELSVKRFFNKAIACSGKPEKITIDKSGSNNAALKSINNTSSKNKEIEIRQIKYLNNILDQDHRFIKKITKAMMGFKAFHCANATLIGIELHHMLHKGQHKNSENMAVYE